MNNEILNTIRNKLTYFNENSTDKNFKELQIYFDYYSLNFEGIINRSGYLKTDIGRIAIFSFTPVVDSKGDILLFHGYLNHTGILANLIGFLTNIGYRVTTADLPGHGLSDGERTGINNFYDYNIVLDTIIQSINFNKNLIFIGHSTGCVPVLNMLLDGKQYFSKVLFCAPLIKTIAFSLGLFSCQLIPGFVKYIPRIFRKASNSKEFIDFQRYHDPLQDRVIATSWTRAYFKWIKTITNKHADTKTPVLVIQGTKDTVVNWRFNLRYLTSLFSNIQSSLISGARHELFNETDTYFSQLTEIIKIFLK